VPARVELAPVALPELPAPAAPPVASRDRYVRRLGALAERTGADWTCVYGDREHFANLAYLCGFDPRFEEALLLLGPDGPYLVVGLEGVGYAAALDVPAEVVLCPTFGLMGQRRDVGRTLPALLAEVGMAPGQRIAVVGWKVVEPAEWDAALPAPIVAPAFVVDALRGAVGDAGLVADATAALMGAADGMRTANDADDIAVLEWGSSRAAGAVARVVAGAEPGMLDFEAARAMGYGGEPLSAHVMLASGPDCAVGLRSPRGRRLERGDGVTTAVGLWGGLCARAGLLAAHGDRPTGASDGFLDGLAVPYFRAVAAWWASVGVGARAGDVHDAAVEELARAGFGPSLNPGHLTHLDEWLHTPIAPGSDARLRSGMALQCDIIPDNARPGWVVNCEDGLALGDAALRDELRARHPALADRIDARRRFMREQLGIGVSDDVLPLSATPGRFSPFWLSPERALVLAG
jgi:Xaa-Pro aminopeptidase